MYIIKAIKNAITEIKKKIIPHEELHGLIKSTCININDCSTIRNALGPFGSKLLKSAVDIKDELDKYDCPNEDFLDLLLKKFEEKEIDNIKTLSKNENFALIIIIKYLWKTLSDDFFSGPICSGEQAYEVVKHIEKLSKRSRSYTTTASERHELVKQMSMVIGEMKKLLQTDLENKKESVAERILEDLSFISLDFECEIPTIIDGLVNLAADVNLCMNKAGVKIEIKNLMPGEPAYMNQIESVYGVKPLEGHGTIFVGLSPTVFCEDVGDNSNVEKTDTYLVGHSLCYKGRVVLALKPK